MTVFPTFMKVEVTDRVLVAGGGATAWHKVRILDQFGLGIDIVATKVMPELLAYAAGREKIQIWEKNFEESDLFREKYIFVIAATDQRQVNARISRCCQQERIPVNVVDDPQNCTFVFPAMVKRGDLICGVSSGGKCPVVSQIIKEKIGELLPEDIDGMIRKLEEYREQIREEIPDHQKRAKAIRQEYYRMEALDGG